MISYDADDFMLYHGVMSEEMRTLEEKLCNSSTYSLERALGKPSKICNKTMEKLDLEVGKDTDLDTLLFTLCKEDDDSVGHVS